MAETEYIERVDAMEIVKRTSGDYAAAFAEIRRLPAADVVEVVRCGDCAHYINPSYDGKIGPRGYCIDLDHIGSYMVPRRKCDFCSYGQRKANQE